MNKTKIDWGIKGLQTWHPVVGCERGCSYCYAMKMNRRFKFVETWTEPQIFYDRLIEPYNVKKPTTIFVGGMTDLWSPWIPGKWKKLVLNTIRMNPQHTFMLLTKNPHGYRWYDMPDNCVMGLTLTDPDRDKFKAFKSFTHGRKFLSIEPIMDSFRGFELDGVELVIVGGMNGEKKNGQEQEWIRSVTHPNIHHKR